MPIQCYSEADCSTGQLCIKEVCSPLTAENVIAKVPAWGWAVVAIGILLIIFMFVRCCCWPDTSRQKKNRFEKGNLNLNGPAPLPINYQKPVDLLQVADANKKAENAILVQQQKIERQKAAVQDINQTSLQRSVYPASSISQQQVDESSYYQSQPQYGFQSNYQESYPESYNRDGYYNAQGSQYPPNQYGYPNQGSVYYDY